MSRLTFWCINLLGAYLILTRNPDEPQGTRVILGWSLIAAGTLGIGAMHYFRHKRRQQEANDESGEVESGG